MTHERYDRQARLREVGEHGQARIARSAVHIARGPAARVALSYLLRAGVERGSIGDFDAAFAHDAWFEFSGPRRVARGANTALEHLLGCLELP
ncbi:MAG: hypothetical protein ACOY0T_40910 [Myxococcota bacterium]